MGIGITDGRCELLKEWTCATVDDEVEVCEQLIELKCDETQECEKIVGQSCITIDDDVWKCELFLTDSFFSNIKEWKCVGKDGEARKYERLVEWECVTTDDEAEKCEQLVEWRLKSVTHLLVREIDNKNLRGMEDLASYIHYSCFSGNFDIVIYIESRDYHFWELWNNCAIGAAKGNMQNQKVLVILQKKGHLEIFKYVVSQGYVDWNYYTKSAEDGD